MTTSLKGESQRVNPIVPKTLSFFTMTKVETLAQSVQRQRRTLSATGVLDISGNVVYPRESLAALGCLKSLVELNVSNSPLTSFESLFSQPCLKVLIANDTQIETLVSLDRQTRLASLSVINTPISQHQYFRLTALLVVGAHLTSINGIPVSQTEKKMALAYPAVAKKLAEAGWIAEYPPPSDLDFRYLARQFGMTVQDIDFVPGTSPPPSPVKSEPVNPEPERFSEKVAAILRPLGFGIRPGRNMVQDICNAVSRLCDVVVTVESLDE
jgi:hypothetical protein